MQGVYSLSKRIKALEIVPMLLGLMTKARAHTKRMPCEKVFSLHSSDFDFNGSQAMVTYIEPEDEGLGVHF